MAGKKSDVLKGRLKSVMTHAWRRAVCQRSAPSCHSQYVLPPSEAVHRGCYLFLPGQNTLPQNWMTTTCYFGFDIKDLNHCRIATLYFTFIGEEQTKPMIYLYFLTFVIHMCNACVALLQDTAPYADHSANACRPCVCLSLTVNLKAVLRLFN